MGSQEINQREIQQQVNSEFPDLLDKPGDFESVRRQVDTLTLEEIEQRGLKMFEASSSLEGVYKVVAQLPTTTSTGVVTEGELVVKTLREPSWRVPDLEEGRIFSDDAPHFLFPWEDKSEEGEHIGIRYQEAALLGEERAGVLYNPNNPPYMGMVGVRDVGDSRIEIKARKEISAEANVWPALVMRKEDLGFNVAQIVLEWSQGQGGWEGLDQEDIVNLVFDGIKAYTDKAIPVTEKLRQRFGDLNFFYRCLLYETPHQAAIVDKNRVIMDRKNGNEREVIKKAAASAKKMIQTTGGFLLKYPDYIDEVSKRLVVGHADSKLSNTCIRAETADEVVEVIRSRKIPFVLLDAQSLAVKSHMMYKQEGVQYAHWRIVPNEQQWAYGLIQLAGMGLDEIHNEVFDRLKQTSGFDYSNGEIDDIWYKLQSIYKMVGVEPYVNSFGYRENQTNGLMELTMKEYPRVGAEIADEISNWLGR